MAVELDRFDPYKDLNDIEFEGLMDYEDFLRGVDPEIARYHNHEDITTSLDQYLNWDARELANLQPTRRRFIWKKGSEVLRIMPKKHHTDEEEVLRWRRWRKTHYTKLVNRGSARPRRTSIPIPPIYILKAPIITEDFESYEPFPPRANGFAVPSADFIPQSRFTVRDAIKSFI